MWKIIIGAVIAVAGMFYLMSKGGNVELGNSEHAITEGKKDEAHAAAPAAITPPAVASPAPAAPAAVGTATATPAPAGK